MNSLGPAEPRGIGRGPPTRICYICGRPYGVNSYDIHLKQCKELWVAREELKEPRERKPLPPDPALKLNQTNKSGNNNGISVQNLDEINKLASEAFNTVSLARCQYCQRTFLPEKLVIHHKSCTPDHPSRRVDESVKRGVEQSLDATLSTSKFSSPNNDFNNTSMSVNSASKQLSSNRPRTSQGTGSSRNSSSTYNLKSSLQRTSNEGSEQQESGNVMNATISTQNINNSRMKTNSSPSNHNFDHLTDSLASTMSSTLSATNIKLKSTSVSVPIVTNNDTDITNHQSSPQLQQLHERVGQYENKINQCLDILVQTQNDMSELKFMIAQLQQQNKGNN